MGADGADEAVEAVESSGSAWVTPLVARPLSSQSRYRDIPELRRLEAVGAPTHVVVHHIDGHADDVTRDYCDVHRHRFAELNVLLGEPGELVFDLVLDGEALVVESPTTVWIPAGVDHSANLRSGRGTFVVVYVAEPQPDPAG